MDISLGIDFRDVTGNEEPVFAEFLGRFFRHLPVSGKNVRPACFQNADLVGSKHIPFIVTDPDFHIRQGRADRMHDPFPIERIGRSHSHFSHAVTFQQRLAGPFPEGDKCFGQQGCRS